MKRTLMGQARMLAGTIVVLALWACGDSDPASTATPHQTKLIFSDVNWSSALLQNAVARTILEKGYGYETESVPGATVPLMEALIAGETNVTMEFWLPSVLAIWHEAIAAETIVQLGNSLASPSWESAFLIPQYTADANPDLRSVEDLKLEEHWSLFVRPDSDGKAGLLTCVSGWECEGINEKQVYGYDLQEIIKLIIPSSFEALNAEILDAFDKRENIIFYQWGPEVVPTKLNEQYGGFLRLKEPDYYDECWDHLAAEDEAQDVTQACAYPDRQPVIVVRSELRETAPEAVAFLEKWTLSDDSINALLARLDETDDAYSDVAAWWLQNSDEWKSWVADGTADKVLAGL